MRARTRRHHLRQEKVTHQLRQSELRGRRPVASQMVSPAVRGDQSAFGTRKPRGGAVPVKTTAVWCRLERSGHSHREPDDARILELKLLITSVPSSRRNSPSQQSTPRAPSSAPGHLDGAGIEPERAIGVAAPRARAGRRWRRRRPLRAWPLRAPGGRLSCRVQPGAWRKSGRKKARADRRGNVPCQSNPSRGAPLGGRVPAGGYGERAGPVRRVKPQGT